MAERFAPGERVRVRVLDPARHTRAPRYVRGQVGTVVEVHGRHRLPDDVVAGAAEARVEPVYAVRFSARTLWGAGDHSVTVNLWETYLTAAPEES
jgi:nitrile hydratase